MKKNIIIKRFFLVVVCLVVLFNVTWFAYTNLKYGKYEDCVGYDKEREMFIDFDDNYYYAVFKPSYPQFKGNLSVGIKDEKDNTKCSMLIWPHIISGYDFGVAIRQYNKDTDGFEVYEIELNSEGKPKEALTETEEKAFNSNADEIKELFDRVNAKWGISLDD